MGHAAIEHVVSLIASSTLRGMRLRTPAGGRDLRAVRSGPGFGAAGDRAWPAGIDLAVAASPFDGVARQMVHGLKYARRLALAQVAAAAMLRALPDHEAAGVVVPVPAGRWRWRWRGFDPAEEIAIAIAEEAALPLERVPAARRRPAAGRPAALGAARGPARGLGRVDVPVRGAAHRRRLDDGRHAVGLRQGAARGWVSSCRCADALEDRLIGLPFPRGTKAWPLGMHGGFGRGRHLRALGDGERPTPHGAPG